MFGFIAQYRASCSVSLLLFRIFGSSGSIVVGVLEFCRPATTSSHIFEFAQKGIQSLQSFKRSNKDKKGRKRRKMSLKFRRRRRIHSLVGFPTRGLDKHARIDSGCRQPNETMDDEQDRNFQRGLLNDAEDNGDRKPPVQPSGATSSSNASESHEKDEEKEGKEAKEEDDTTVNPDHEGGRARGNPAPSTASLENVRETNMAVTSTSSSAVMAQSSSNRADRTLESSYQKLAELEKFKEKNGHCDVPQNYGPLGNW